MLQLLLNINFFSTIKATRTLMLTSAEIQTNVLTPFIVMPRKKPVLISSMPHGSQTQIISYTHMVCADFFSFVAPFRVFFRSPFVLVLPYLFSYLPVYTFLTFAFWPLKSLLFTFTGFFSRRRFFALVMKSVFGIMYLSVLMYVERARVQRHVND